MDVREHPKTIEAINKILTDKTYEQAIGFLRINEGINPLHQTVILPEM